MRTAWLFPLAALAACASPTNDPADPSAESLASLCDGYYAAVARLTPGQAAKVDQGNAMKVDANCNGSGTFGPKPNGNKMAQIREATAKVQALGKS
jgi:hypothetical protein